MAMDPSPRKGSLRDILCAPARQQRELKRPRHLVDDPRATRAGSSADDDEPPDDYDMLSDDDDDLAKDDDDGQDCAWSHRPKKKGKASDSPSKDAATRQPRAGRQPKPPPKVKVPAARKSGRLGRLSTALTGLPIEMLSEILSHSTPATLLRLSRTAKVFRTLLFTKSSRSIWLHAFLNDGFPEAFAATDFNEPTLARLIWDKECWICGRQKVHKIIWTLRARYCDVCLKQELLPKPELQETLRELGLHPAVWQCTPRITRPPWSYAQTNGEYFIRWAIKNSNAKLKQLAALDTADLLFPPTPAPAPTPDSTFESGPPSPSDAASPSEPAPAAAPEPPQPPKTRVTLYLEEYAANSLRVDKDCKMLEEWQKSLDKGRADERIMAQQKRGEAITAHLIKAGYAEADIANALAAGTPVHVHVDQPYPLTDRVWRKVGPIIKEYLDQVRRSREAEEEAATQRHAATLRAQQQEAALAASGAGGVGTWPDGQWASNQPGWENGWAGPGATNGGVTGAAGVRGVPLPLLAPGGVPLLGMGLGLVPPTPEAARRLQDILGMYYAQEGAQEGGTQPHPNQQPQQPPHQHQHHPHPHHQQPSFHLQQQQQPAASGSGSSNPPQPLPQSGPPPPYSTANANYLSSLFGGP